MEVDRDHKKDWFHTQLEASCNVEPSFFNDWFTGHLDYQIEHHLFPTMPRHNYYKVQPHIKALCAKYKVPYVEKTLYRAFADITTYGRWPCARAWGHAHLAVVDPMSRGGVQVAAGLGPDVARRLLPLGGVPKPPASKKTPTSF